jgi:hypothetical protein
MTTNFHSYQGFYRQKTKFGIRRLLLLERPRYPLKARPDKSAIITQGPQHLALIIISVFLFVVYGLKCPAFTF